VGKLLLQHAETIERQSESFFEQLSLIKRASEGRIKIGVGAVAAQTLLPRVVAALHVSHPKLLLEVFSGVMHGMIPDLLTGEIDLVVGVETEALANQQIEKKILGYEKFCIVVGASHPIHQESNFRINKLLEFPWILGRNLGELAPAIVKTFLMDGISIPENVTYTTSSEFSVSILKTMDAVAILPQQLVQSSVDAGDLVVVGDKKYSWLKPLALVCSKQEQKSTSLIAVINCIQKVCKDHPMDGFYPS
jgi:DNA-binding transcriptional LysR family regulator